MILTIDPALGTTGGTGLAWWEEGELLGACVIRPERVPDKAERCRRLVAAAVATLHSYGPLVRVDLDAYAKRFAPPALTIYEWPQIYVGSPNDPNDLLGLVGVGAAIASAVGSKQARCILPREWKGSLDGDAMAERIESRLTEKERARIEPCAPSMRHNVLDSIGIGLFYFGRLERKRALRR